MAYAIANVTKFLDEHPEIEPEIKAGIVERAERFAVQHSGTGGIFSGGAVLEIFGNPELADHFKMEAVTGEHIKIGLDAIRESVKINSDNPILVGMTL